MVIFWAGATLLAFVILCVCAAAWWRAMDDQREGYVPQPTRYWKQRDQDLS